MRTVATPDVVSLLDFPKDLKAVGEQPTDRWGSETCPLRGPRFPFSGPTRIIFHNYFVSHLNTCQDMFDAHFKGPDKERSEAEGYLKQELSHVAACDAWREALNYSAAQVAYPPVILTVITCFVLPWLIASNQWWYNVLATVASLVAAALLIRLLKKVGALFYPRQVDGELGLLAILALSAGVITWMYTQHPLGWVFFATTAVAFASFCTVLFLVNLARLLTIALISRVKVTRYFNAELSDSILSMLEHLSSKDPNLKYVASQCYYVAKIIEQHWQQLLTAQTTSPAAQQRVRDTVRGVAAGMHEMGLSATFSTKSPDSKENFEVKLMDKMARQLTALTTFRYGDLIVAEATEIIARPWPQRVFRGAGSVIAALAPITLLLVLPKVFHFTISANLYGTLLTVSLAWLALYVIGWLDPKALAKVSSLQKVTGLIGRG